MAELRQRFVESKNGNSEEEDCLTHLESESSDVQSKAIPKEAPKDVIDSAFPGIPSRWKNWIIRGIFTWLMLGVFGLIIYGGPWILILTTFIIQVKCFAEIINIGYGVYRIHNLPWFRSLSWYFLLTSNYFLYGESFVDFFGDLVHRVDFLNFLVHHHRFISFSMYIVGFVWFVLSLVKKYYLRQFSLFAWTHVALLIVVTQSYLIIQNMFEGLIWFIMPITMVVINDVMAYMFGFFLGRTPLIKLSPKKTWEGFIGGGFATIGMSLCLGYTLCKYNYFICPIEYNDMTSTISHWDCEPSGNFVAQEYQVSNTISSLREVLGMKSTITVYPFLLHVFFMSIFASVIGPFGGFFASGFKRAFKIKDFGDVIPGHGGIMDRFDCQFLMATFVNVYIRSFVQTATPQRLIQHVLMLKPEEQLQLHYLLHDSLLQRGIIQP